MDERNKINKEYLQRYESKYKEMLQIVAQCCLVSMDSNKTDSSCKLIQSDSWNTFFFVLMAMKIVNLSHKNIIKMRNSDQTYGCTKF